MARAPIAAVFVRAGRVWRAPAAATCLGLALLSAPVHAALFGDDEARRAILELRERVEANRQAAESADQALQQALKAQMDEGDNSGRRGLLDLINQMEALRAEMAALRGQNEQLARELAVLQQQQKDLAGAFDERLRTVEPVSVTVDGLAFNALPAEKALFEEAMAVLRATQFAQAAELYTAFLQRYPLSGYAPLALYWRGNALYATRNYTAAIDAYRQLLARHGTHPRAPEAMLAIANCQLELKDGRAAKATLQELVKLHPDTEAGTTAKERLSRLR